jgi:hypothetical protein
MAGGFLFFEGYGEGETGERITCEVHCSSRQISRAC